MDLQPHNLSARVRASLGARSDDPRRSDLVRALLEYSFTPPPASWGHVLALILAMLGLAAVMVWIWPGLMYILPHWLAMALIVVMGLVLAAVTLGIRYGHDLDYSIDLATIEEQDPNANPDKPGERAMIERIDHFRLGAFGELLSLDNSLIKVSFAFILTIVLALIILLWNQHLGFEPAPDGLAQALQYAAGSSLRWLLSLLESRHWADSVPVVDGTWNKVILVGFRFFIDGLLLLAAVQAYQTLKIRNILHSHGSAAVTLPDPNRYAFRKFPDEVVFMTVASHFANRDMASARAFASLCPQLDISDDVRALFETRDGPIFVKPA